MSSIRPVVLLAFADARRDLASLKHEGWSLRDQFEALKRHGVVADVVVEERALLDRIYSVLQRHRDRIAIFHFGGHADADSLLLESALGPGAAHAEGLATLLGRQRGLKLVFLNGCSTRPQVARLLDAGVPAVIATARPIDDALAVRFAVAFYQALTTGHEDARGKVAGGCGIASAFAQAEGLAQAAGGGKLRDLGDESAAHDIFDDRGLPWNVFYRPGAEEVARWTLFDDDPMFGLPELPGDIGRPPEPFRRLEWFGREHARIFFGRGRAIRGLYDLVTRPAAPAEARVLLYYGQTGVGKTSVLAAGLLPRLEVSHQVRYLRRSADAGLLGTLRDELDKSFDPFDLGRAWAAIEASGQPLVVVLDQAEEAYTRPRVAPPSADGAEALTRSWIDPEAEIRELIEAVRVAFDPTRPDRPAGRLILGFRKEWLDEFEKACKAAGLAFQPVPLGSLDRAGVIEAIEGPARDPRNQVWLAEPAPGDPSIAEFIADDLLRTLADPKKNAESPVAPTLQILLTRMWADARERDRDRPTFDRPLYTALKSQGFQLGEVLDQQLAAIREADPAAVDLGLILDLLEHFTTPLGTAAARTRAEVVARYPRQASDRLDALIRRCQEGYLLVETGVGTDSAATYRLVHDTLAPLVRDRFQRSLALVPRARRILEKRALEWSDGCEGPPLDAHDLSIVESAAAVLPAWTKDEERLLESSREAERRRLADEVERQRQ
ncbi:MAG TPA: CHAT domain-containing protein, partial [Isosphaeraceae bacterium]